MEHTKISEQFDILTWIPNIDTYEAILSTIQNVFFHIKFLQIIASI